MENKWNHQGQCYFDRAEEKKSKKIHKIMIEINEAYTLDISNGNKYEKK